MSEQEFELYLKLLSRCLGLTSGQREQIADELRDHLEERLDELARAGLPRDQAVLQAIDEFGDAAVLAGHFTTIAHLKRRRFLMRLSLGSVAALAAVLLVAFAFWPENRAVQGPPQLFAQNKSQPSKPAAIHPAPTTHAIALPAVTRPSPPAVHEASKGIWPTPIPADHPLSSDVGQNPRIEAALESRVDFIIDPQPLKDALEFIAQRYQIPLLIDTKTLEDASIDTSSEVKMLVAGLKLRQMLTLLLQQLPQPLGFDIEDGVLRITTIEQIHEHTYVVVYDCRDLIHLRSMYPGAVTRPEAQASEPEATAARGGLFSSGADSTENARQFGGAGPAKATKKVEHSPKSPCAQDDIPLVRVIRYAGDSNAWDDAEAAGPKITEIGGLLVVNQNPMVHEQIKRILADLRRMKKEGAFATVEPPRAAAPNKPSPAAKESGL